jgi:hypothetical protein
VKGRKSLQYVYPASCFKKHFFCITLLLLAWDSESEKRKIQTLVPTGVVPLTPNILEAYLPNSEVVH